MVRLLLFTRYMGANSPDRRRPTIIDTTLRDGEQGSGISFAPEQKLRIVQGLAESGVDEIEAGIPTIADEEIEFYRSCTKSPVPVRCWCRAADSDIEAAERTGLAHVHVSVPVSCRYLAAFGRSHDWVLDRVGECFEKSRRSFDSVTLGLMDASRADSDFLATIVFEAARSGYARVCIVDSTGVLSPLGTTRLIDEVIDLGAPIEFHAHNDLGMGSANAITALEAGASAVSATILGIGERAGNARVEEIAYALVVSEGFDTGLDLGRLASLCRLVSDAIGRPIASDHPVIGEYAFAHETGMHVAGMLHDPLVFLPIDPRTVGLGEIQIHIGRHSGSRSIQHALSTCDISVDRATASALLPIVRERAAAYRRTLASAELEAIYYEFVSTHITDRHGWLRPLREPGSSRAPTSL